jgi:H/ACA ribonucleoprotein complex subunit 4
MKGLLFGRSSGRRRIIKEKEAWKYINVTVTHLNQEEKETKMERWIKKASKTDPTRGCSPEKRSLKQIKEYGIINLNKPQGPTSHQVADHIKKIFNVDKAGHSGTLDPNVTGVLPIALAKATRIVNILLKSNKEYVALMHIHKKVTEQQIRKVIEEFTGKIKQTPPRKSAVKRQERQRTIHEFQILEIHDQDVLFRVSCQAGTYIRTLIHNIGIRLGTGAHMTQLVRTKTGPFTYHSWHSLQDVKDAVEFANQGKEEELRKIIVPVESALINIPKIWVHDSAVNTLCHGSSLGIPGIAELSSTIQKGETVAIMTLKDELICLATATTSASDLMKNDKGLAAITDAVFMERNTYPSMPKDL